MTRSEGRKRVVIVGATGMVGGHALRYALDDAAVERVTTIGRRPIGLSHPKLNEVLHDDFADCSALAGSLSQQDAAVFCLGAYTGAVSDAELRRVTVDYTIEFARVLRGSSPAAAFSFLSGNGGIRLDEAVSPSHGTRARPRRRCLRQGFRACTSSAPGTSTQYSRAESPISAIA